MNVRTTLRYGLLGLCLCVASSTAFATTVLKISLQEMTLGSDLIIQGTVSTARTVALRGNERHLQTQVTLQVHNVIKGKKGMKTLRLDLMGGKLGKWVMHIPGMPSFNPGEDVVLFLEKTKSNWALTGLSQGKFVVQKDQDGVRRVRRMSSGVHFMAKDGQGRIRETSPPKPMVQELGSFLAEIRTYLTVASNAK